MCCYWVKAGRIRSQTSICNRNVIFRYNFWKKVDSCQCVLASVLTPWVCFLVQYIIISSLLNPAPLMMFDYKFPDWSIMVGYIIGFSSFIWIPVYMVYKLVWTPGSLKQVRTGKCFIKTLHVYTTVLLCPGFWLVSVVECWFHAMTFDLWPLPPGCWFCSQRLAVCLRPERTLHDIHTDTLGLTPVP